MGRIRRLLMIRSLLMLRGSPVGRGVDALPERGLSGGGDSGLIREGFFMQGYSHIPPEY